MNSMLDVESILRRARDAYVNSARPALVVELLRSYVAVVPDNELAWFQYGDSLRELGRFREAEQALLTARQLASGRQRWVAESRLGMLESRRGSLEHAERWFSLATAADKCPGWVWVLRGANLLRMESIPLARDCLNTALDLPEVDREEALLNLALAAEYMEEYEKAAELANEALKIDEHYPEARELLASLEGAKEVRDEMRAR